MTRKLRCAVIATDLAVGVAGARAAVELVNELAVGLVIKLVITLVIKLARWPATVEQSHEATGEAPRSARPATLRR
jgi:hypothetical protein